MICPGKDLATSCMLVLICAVFFTQKANAQDRIIRKDGKQIEAKVLGKDAQYLRYKRQDNPNGPDYFIYLSEVLRIENNKDTTAHKGDPLKLAREQAVDAAIDIALLERKAKQYHQRGIVAVAVGTAVFLGGAVTIVKLNSDFNRYQREIRTLNDTYTDWYFTNYQKAPPASDLKKQDSFTTFASPGVYLGAAAVAAGIALDLVGLKNIRLARKVRAELATKKKELTVRPFHEPGSKTTGVRVAFSF